MTSLAGRLVAESCVAVEKHDGGVGDDHLPYYTRQDVSKHADPYSDQGCWVVIDSYVYDITKFMHEHPGGFEILLEHAGYDATNGFRSINHSDQAKQRLATLRIGRLKKN